MKLIDAEELAAEMYHKSFEVDDGRNVWHSGLWIRYQIFDEAIREAPAVDAVPVIRCRDCKYKNEHGQCTYYINFHHWTDDMDYCSGAERRDKRNG